MTQYQITHKGRVDQRGDGRQPGSTPLSRARHKGESIWRIIDPPPLAMPVISVRNVAQGAAEWRRR